jgi:hypothetical protein
MKVIPRCARDDRLNVRDDALIKGAIRDTESNGATREVLLLGRDVLDAADSAGVSSVCPRPPGSRIAAPTP